jgi:hypothetical protein
MEARDHTGNLAGGIALAALGYQFTDPIEGMALAVGDLAMLSVTPTDTTSQSTVGDPPQPLTNWLPDYVDTSALALPPERDESVSPISLGGSSFDGGANGPLDDFWSVPTQRDPGPASITFPEFD